MLLSIKKFSYLVSTFWVMVALTVASLSHIYLIFGLFALAVYFGNDFDNKQFNSFRNGFDLLDRVVIGGILIWIAYPLYIASYIVDNKDKLKKLINHC